MAFPRSVRFYPSLYLHSRLQLIVLAMGLLSSFLCISAATAEEFHPFHICVGEMEWNSESKKWEASLRLHLSDLQTAVSRVSKKRIEIDPSKAASQELVRYVTDHFMLVSKPIDDEQKKGSEESKATDTAAKDVGDPDSLSKLDWIGMEMERGWLWVFVELTPPKKAGTLSISHRLLLDDVEDQKNTLLILEGKKRTSLRFLKGADRQPMP